MQQVPAWLSGFRGLRAELLVALKKAPQPLTAKELAEQFGVTPNALRRHLDSLEAEGYVRYRREVRGVGAPVHTYSLTAQGEALFPQGHAAVLAAVLESVREVSGPEGVIALARRQWQGLVADASPRLAELPLHERAQLLAELRSSQGFMAEAHADGDVAVLREHHCAIRDVAERFPEICVAEQEFVEQMLATPVRRTAHILDGCSCCEYTAVPNDKPNAGADAPDQEHA
jgi:DeoR family suf operon transcriptional repressor